VVISLQAVPPVLNYAGQVAVNGQPFEGDGLFKFALVNTDGKITYWSNDATSVNGSEPQASVKVPVSGGLYSLLLGNTAIPGMGAINPQVFAQHTDAKLRVWFSDGVNGFQQLSPDRPFASVPYAFSAGNAQSAGSANIANGSVSLDMLSQDLKNQINAPISRSRLSQEVLADINATISLNRLSSEVTEKLNQEKTTNHYNAPSVGSLLTMPYGSDAPAGYSLYQRGTPKALVWEEKAPITKGRGIFDGIETLGGKIYLIGGGGTNEEKKFVERYSTLTNTWETISPLLEGRFAVASTALDSKIFAVGGVGVSSSLSSVEIFDPDTGAWTSGQPLPNGVNRSDAITVNNKIYLAGGWDAANQNTDQLLCFDPLTNAWDIKASMNYARHGAKVVWFENRIWVIGGNDGSEHLNKVESYDPISNTWREEASLNVARHLAVSWVANGNIYVGGGWNPCLNSVEYYDSFSETWKSAGTFPENKGMSGAVVSGSKVYIVSGESANGVKSNKVFAADLNASVDGVYDLYRKDGNASAGTPLVHAEVPDGSVTTAKLDSTILKYLKPEITSEPQAQTVYGETNATFSVTAEGKYLTYQWKKDGLNLTGETNATLTISDANASLHDGNYSVVVSNDFGSAESDLTEVLVKDGILNGLVGWWRFDEGSGTVAYDSSGNGHHGNLLNSSTWTNGKIGGAISLDGTNDYVEISSRKWNIENLFSISFWYLNNGTNGTIFSLGTPPYNNEILLWILEGRQDFYYHKGSGNWARIHEPTLSQGWHHKTIIVNGGYQANQLSSFINGNLYQSTYTNGGISGLLSDVQDRVLRIGYRVNDSQFYNGLIDDVRIYDRALSAVEVQALYNMGQ